MINISKIQEKINSCFGGSVFAPVGKAQKEEFFTITDLLPYRFFDEEEGVFINDGSVGFVIEASPLVGADDSVIDTLQGIFSDAIPQGCTIQFMSWASPKISGLIKEWQSVRNNVGGIYKTMAQKRVDFFKDSHRKSLFDTSPFTLKDFQLVISVSISYPKSDKVSPGHKSLKSMGLGRHIENLTSFRQKLIRSLETAGMSSRELSPKSLINLLDEIVNFNESSKSSNIDYDNLMPINKQIVAPDNNLRVGIDQVSLFSDDKSRKVDVRCFSVRNYPSSWAQWQCRDLIGDYMQDLRRMEYPFITSFSVTLPDNEKSLVSKAKQKSFNATRVADSEMSKFLPEMKTAAKEWQFVCSKLNDGQRILKTIYQIAIFAPPHKINEAESSLKSIYRTNGWDIVRDKYINIQSFLALLPFTQSAGLYQDLEKLNRTKTMVSWTCANLAPLQAEWKGMNSPCMMLYGRRGQPFFWNPFKNDEGNYNVAVVGKSGSGKSVFMQELVASILGFGGKVYVIDDGRSFMNSCLLQKGEFIEFSEKSKICLNPFSIVNDEVMKSNPEYKSEVTKLIKSMIRQMCEGEKANSNISQVQDRYIEEAVQNAWQQHGNKASISVVKDYFLKHKDDRAKDLAILIGPFTKDGIYGRFFEGKSNIKLENAFMVFELAELKNKKEFQSIVLMFLMFLVSENMYFGDRKTPISLLIDEAWDLLHGEGSKTFIEGLARRARKYCGNIITGTQSVNDYYKTPATVAAFENTDWVVLLSQKKESIEQLAQSKKIVMDGGLKKVLSSLRMVDHQYSECLIYGPRGYAVGRLILDPYSIALFSSKAQDWAKITQLRDEGYELEQALEIIAQHKNKDKEVTFFDRSDYIKILSLVENKQKEIGFEDALEVVTKEKIQKKFPKLANNLYKT